MFDVLAAGGGPQVEDDGQELEHLCRFEGDVVIHGTPAQVHPRTLHLKGLLAASGIQHDGALGQIRPETETAPGLGDAVFPTEGLEQVVPGLGLVPEILKGRVAHGPTTGPVLCCGC